MFFQHTGSFTQPSQSGIMRRFSEDSQLAMGRGCRWCLAAALPMGNLQDLFVLHVQRLSHIAVHGLIAMQPLHGPGKSTATLHNPIETEHGTGFLVITDKGEARAEGEDGV